MSWVSKWLGLDKNKELERTLNAVFRATVPFILTGKAAGIKAWADRHGIDEDALDELVDILDGVDHPAVAVASVPPAA